MLKTYLTASVAALACVLSSCHHNSATTNRNSITNTQSIQGLAPDSMIGKTITLFENGSIQPQTCSWVNATSNEVVSIKERRKPYNYTSNSHHYTKTGYNTATLRTAYSSLGECNERSTEEYILTFLTPTSGKYRGKGLGGIMAGIPLEGTFTLK